VHRALMHFEIVMGIAIAALVGGFWQLRKGTSALDQLRTRLASVHRGEAPRVTGRYPSEVQPLVDDLNALLADRERSVQRAVAKAGDLAHGLKTPLAVLSQEAQRAAQAGYADVAASVGHEVGRMRKHIDHHLAHARAVASGVSPGTHAVVKTSADALSRTLTQLHAERGIAIDVRVAPEHAVRCPREDLEEMLGNLLDNASKWAHSKVSVAVSARPGANGDATAGGWLHIRVDDDGPGLTPEQRAEPIARGRRLDETKPGSGLGHSIVADLAYCYSGSLELDRSEAGGLSARLTLPLAT
jgi:signal transduction histidine kinase